MPTARGTAFAAAMRVINWVHRHTAVMRSPTLPAGSTRLPQLLVLVVDVADATDGRSAIDQDTSHFTRWQFQECVATFAGHQADFRTCRTTHLATLARSKLHVVNQGP